MILAGKQDLATEMIEAQGLAKYFGRFTALRSLTVSIGRGEFISLFGRNGAGKTTFLRIVAGLSRPSSGVLRILNPQPLSPPAARGLMGYLSHNTALYLDLTALENLRFYARASRPCLIRIRSSRAEIERVGLAGRGQEPVRNYSRGMQQRLAIARAFLHDPQILLLDEPFTGLDQAGTEFLKDYLAGARRDGKTCLMAIHDVPLGYELADRLVVIEKGVVALDLSKSSVSLDEFQSRYADLAEERSMLAKIWAIFRKDMLIELRTKDSLNAMLFFGIVVLVIFNFALESVRESIRAAVPGVLWVAFAFSGTLGLNRMFAAEKENSCLQGLLMVPIDRGILYLGKMLAASVFMLITEVVVFVFSLVFFNLTVWKEIP